MKLNTKKMVLAVVGTVAVVALGWATLGPAALAKDFGRHPNPRARVTFTTANMIDRTVQPWEETVGASFLKRTFSGVELEGYTRNLEPGHAYTIWWLIYNQPENCVNGDGSFDVVGCGQDEIDDPALADAAATSMLYAGGFMANDNGYAHFTAKLKKGNPLGQVGMGPGLLFPNTAEIHFLIRDHGPAEAGLTAAQMSTFGANCDVAGGAYPCSEVQSGAHPPVH